MISHSRRVQESRNFIEDVDRSSSDLSRSLQIAEDVIEQSRKSIVCGELQLEETRPLTQQRRWLKQRGNVFQRPDRGTYSLPRVRRYHRQQKEDTTR